MEKWYIWSYTSGPDKLFLCLMYYYESWNIKSLIAGVNIHEEKEAIVQVICLFVLIL